MTHVFRGGKNHEVYDFRPSYNILEKFIGYLLSSGAKMLKTGE